MNVSGLLCELTILFDSFFMRFSCLENILKILLIFFLVFVCFFRAWQFLDEEYIDNFDEFILNQLISEHIKHF
jgi:hypothetical protein